MELSHLGTRPEANPEEGNFSMRPYELVVIFHPEIDPESLATLSSRIVSIITEHNGEIVAQQTWGRKRLAYPIKHLNDGYYVLWHFKANAPALVRELESMLLITEPVLRYLTVRAEGLPALTPDREPEPAAVAEGESEEA